MEGEKEQALMDIMRHRHSPKSTEYRQRRNNRVVKKKITSEGKGDGTELGKDVR